MSGVTFYTGLGGEKTWNYYPITPGPYACISPVRNRNITLKGPDKTPLLDSNGKPVVVGSATNNYLGAFPKETKVLQDSGAFTYPWGQRPTFAQALECQIKHASRYGYADQITHRVPLDLLIDEVWVDGIRQKKRWDSAKAEAAVDITVAAARFLHQNRNGLSLVVSAQGVNAEQYLRCTQRLMPFIQDGDYFGFGGWCITGKMPKHMMTVLCETVKIVIPFLAKEGVKHVHIFGVIFPTALGVLLWQCDQYGITVSTDSVGPTLAPMRGQWGYGKPSEGGWRKAKGEYFKPFPEIMGQERIRHTTDTRERLARLSETPFYRSPESFLQRRANKRAKRHAQQLAFDWGYA